MINSSSAAFAVQDCLMLMMRTFLHLNLMIIILSAAIISLMLIHKRHINIKACFI